MKIYFAQAWVRFLKICTFFLALYCCILLGINVKMLLSENTRYDRVSVVAKNEHRCNSIEYHSSDWCQEMDIRAEKYAAENGNRARDSIWYAISSFDEAIFSDAKSFKTLNMIPITFLIIEVCLLIFIWTKKSFNLVSNKVAGNESEVKVRDIKNEFFTTIKIATIIGFVIGVVNF